MSRIVRLEAENLKRLVAVDISPGAGLVEVTGRNGQGKQQPISEPVLTPSGWKSIGSIEPGDFVVGSNGLPTRVKAVFPQETRETYRITMADGASTRCGPDHLWTVSRWAENSGEKDRVTETLTTAAIIEAGLRRGTGRKWALPIVAPIVFVDRGQELPIDPYTLGVILGDGHIEPSGYVTVTSWDDYVLDAIAPTDHWRAEHELGTGYWSRPIRHIGLAGKRSWEKFIPEAYLWANTESRTALLHGLMDADGTPESSWASFCSTSRALSEGVAHLAHSLGFVCKQRQATTKKYTYNGERREGRPAYYVQIKSDVAPFSLPRKVDAWSKSEQRGERWRFIDTIERVEDEDSVCIQVEAEDGLYVTRDFILTHNTSVLDAIWWALAGTKNVQAMPIRAGEQKARVTVDLGELVVTRTFTKKGDNDVTTSLRVETADGMRPAKPQQMLDSLLGALTFDPLEFVRMDAKDQVATLRQFVSGFDFSEADRQNKEDFDARAALNKRAKDLRGAAQLIFVPPDTPKEGDDEQAILDQIATVGARNDDIRKDRAEIESLIRRARDAEAEADRANAKADELEQEVERLRGEAIAARSRAFSYEEEARTAPDPGEPVSTADLLARLASAKALNEQVRKRAERDKLVAEARELEKRSEDLTEAMAARTRAKADAVRAASLPVEGLELGAEEISLNGVPFSQASDAEQLRASIGVAMAMAPGLKVLRIRDGSLLDDESMALVAAMADNHGFQCWVETVSSGRPGAIVIEDGKVKG